jgi:cell division protein FtsQ
MSATTSYLRPGMDEDDEDAAPPDRRRRALLIVAAVVVAAVLITWLVAFSPVLGVSTVQVRGMHVLTAAQVRAAANITDGTPLVRIDTTAITRRIERLAEVESAQVRTSFPSTVVITVDERTPVGYVRRGGRDVLVDRTGDQYRTVPSAPVGLPRFVVPDGTDSRTTGGAVATVAAALPAALLKKVASIEALDPRAISLVLRHGRVVAWGSAERSADKARILPALLAQPGTQFDVSDPDQPFSRGAP